ncbi:hypothetical protein MRX96_011052 [Rhipicephalus microplus]
MALSSRRASRRIWAYPRFSRWFEDTPPKPRWAELPAVVQDSRTAFKYLVDVGTPVMQRQTTNMREVVSVQKKGRCFSLHAVFLC